MRHVITRDDKHIEIRLLDIGNDSDAILQKFGGCCATETGCRREHYRTLESVRATRLSNGIAISLTARNHAILDISEAERCLDNTADHILAND